MKIKNVIDVPRVTPCDYLQQGLSSVWNLINSFFQCSETSGTLRAWKLPSGRKLFAAVAILMVGGAYQIQTQRQREPYFVEKDRITGRFVGIADDKEVPASVCIRSELTDEEFYSFTPNEISIAKEYLKYNDCHGVDKKIMSLVRSEFRDVIKNMGNLDPDQLYITRYRKGYRDSRSGRMDADLFHTVRVGEEFIHSLIGWGSIFSPEETRGVFAHEVAHIIYRHCEKALVAELELLGKDVESINIIYLVVNLLKSRIPAQIHLAEMIYHQLPYSVHERIREASESILAKDPNFDRNSETEADLLTLSNPEFARGLIKFFSRRIAECGDNSYCLKLASQDSSSHPSNARRIQYLTEALCEQYPEENRDLCPNAVAFNNATCPRIIE